MCLSLWLQTLRTHAKMQHNVILPTESKKGKKLGPRKNKTLRTSKPQVAPQIIRQTQAAIILPNITPLNLASSHNSQDDQSVASEDSWTHQVRFWPQFYIQLVYRPHFGAWILLFGPFGQLRQQGKKKWIWVILSIFWGCFFLLFEGKIFFKIFLKTF